MAAAQQAAANYQATVITAFQNVSDTLYALQGDAEALAAQTTAERTAAGSLDAGAGAVQERRRELPAGTDRGAKLTKRRHRARQGARAALCGYRGAVPSAGRRLVEPKRKARRHEGRGGFRSNPMMNTRHSRNEYLNQSRDTP